MFSKGVFGGFLRELIGRFLGKISWKDFLERFLGKVTSAVV